MKPDLVQRLQEKGFTVEEGKYSSNALYVTGENLTGTRAYKDGLFSIQDESSQMASQMLDPKHGETVIDVCAAPGGKTLAIAERMNNRGRVLAYDIYKRKLEIVDREAARLGINIVETKTWDATKIDSSVIGKADQGIGGCPLYRSGCGEKKAGNQV